MADRFLEALALILKEETGYTQPVGGPYCRTEDGHVLDEASGMLRTRDGSLRPLPKHADGMAFDDDPHDHGGRTGMGILQREYDAWRNGQGLPTRDVWIIADRELEIIYRRQYWDALDCDRIEPGVGEMTFNTGVNAGVGIAVRQLQMVAGVKVDGHLGEITLDAVNALVAKETVHKLAELQGRRYRHLSTFKYFGDNWLGRNRRIEVYCAAHAQDIALDHPAVTAAVAEIGEAEERSPKAHEPAPEEGMGSTTNQAAASQAAAGASLPTLKIVTIAKGFIVAGKSLLSLEFALEVVTDPEVWVFSMMGLGIVWGGLHIMRERARRYVTMGVH